MCDFHSIVINRNGDIAHVPGNSHSGAIAAAGWPENTVTSDMHGKNRFIEMEWDGKRPMPEWGGAFARFTGDYTQSQRKAGERHYAKLAAYLAGDDKDAKYFDQPEYLDVRLRRIGGSVEGEGDKLTVHLNSATIPAGFTLPNSVTTVYLSSATIPAGFTLPNSVTTVYLSSARQNGRFVTEKDLRKGTK